MNYMNSIKSSQDYLENTKKGHFYNQENLFKIKIIILKVIIGIHLYLKIMR